MTSTLGGRFDSDVAFLSEHTQVVLLADRSGAQVAVAPGYQGRVMTSTTGGSDAPSFGWIGRAAVATGNRQPHMNVFGGEDRFWLGPEGGQFSLYFKTGDPFDLDHWQVPEPIDWGAWEIQSQSSTAVRFRKRLSLINYSRTRLEIDVERTVRLLTRSDVTAHLGESPGSGVRTVGYELETSSPALELAPGERYTHVHRTFHFVGAEADLDRIARHTLRMNLREIAGAFAPM